MPQGYRSYFLVFGAALAVLIASAIWFELQNHEQAMISARKSLIADSDVLNQSVNGGLAVIDTALQSLVAARRQDLAFGSRSRGEIEAGLDALVDVLPQVSSLGLINRDGKLNYASDVNVPRGLDVADRLYFRVFADDAAAEGPFLMSPALSRVSQQWFVGMSRPIRSAPDGEFEGVALALVEARWLHSGYLNRQMRAGFLGALVMDDGVIVDALDPLVPGGDMIGRKLAEAPTLRNMDASIFQLPPAGETRVVETDSGMIVVRRIGELPLGLVIYRDWDSVLADWQHGALADGAVLFGAIVLLVGLWIPVSRAGRERDRLFSVSRDPVAVFDLNGRFLRANPAWSDLLGLPSERLPSMTAFDLIHPDDLETTRSVLGQLTAGQHVEDFTCRVLSTAGNVLWLSWSAVAEGGRIFAIARNVTHRLEVEEQLRLSEQRFRDVVEASGEFIWEVDASGTLEFISDRIRAILGHLPADLIGQPMADVLTGAERTALIEAFRRGGLFRLELQAMRTTGQVVWLRLVGRPVKNADGAIKGFRGACLDITEAHQARQEVADSEARYRSIVNTVVDGIITIDERGTIQSANPAAERIFEYSAREMIGNNVKMLMDEPYRAAHDGYLTNYMRTGTPKIIGIGREVHGRRKSGEIFPLDLGVSEVWFGHHRSFIGMCRDVSERKRIERLKDEFVSTVSHELRTPLTSIRGSLGLISGGAVGELPDKARRLLDIAFKNCERLVNLVNDILDIQKIESGRMAFDMRPVDLMILAHRAIEEMAGFARQFDISLDLADGPESVLIRGDSDRLLQVIINLLSNAAKFSPAGGTVTMDLMLHGEKVYLSVRDKGAGIPENFHDQIFSKFSQADSTDARGKGGTGLGLSIVKAIVEAHGGTISFESEEGKGTTFTAVFPLTRPLEHETELALANLGSIRASGKLLIVEDDPDVARLLGLMVQAEGFSADVALDGATARRFLAKQTYDAMTCDVLLPDGDGLSLIRDLREDGTLGDLPVIIVSAVASETERRIEGSTIGVSEWLRKPIDEKRLKASLRKAVPVDREGRISILYVEDDPDLQLMIVALLETMATMTSAYTLAEARQMLAKQTFDLVLLDVGLPDGSGLDLIDGIQAMDPHPAVVLLSGQSLEQEDAGGVAATLLKSKVDNSELISVIRAAVTDRHAHDRAAL